MLISKLKQSQTWKRLPPFIKEAKVFNHINRIEKPFPQIGLPNIIEPLEADFPGKDGRKMYIGFSSQAMMGLWDIATMSMRGVCSCMHWENPHSTHLVGSVTDPFLGIVYITDNKLTPYGITFNWRSLVRFVYCWKSKEYKLLLERVYKDTGNKIPTVYNNKDAFAPQISEVFRSFLKKHVDPKFRVILPAERAFDSSRYMVTTVTPSPDSLKYLHHTQISMSDCHQSYMAVEDAFAAKFASQI